MAEKKEKKKGGCGLYVWGNLLAMAVVAAALVLGVAYGLDRYTHHGEAVEIPNVKYLMRADAERQLRDLGMEVVVGDTGYVKTQPADCVLEVLPQVGRRVKTGHVVRLVVNASKSPTLTVPDLVDNSSLREAMARLTAMGFRVGLPEHVAGERDWVYGLKADGKEVGTGDRVSVDTRITIVVGNGLADENDSIRIVSSYDLEEDAMYEGLFDEDDGSFEED